jgi:hypothetical protein
MPEIGVMLKPSTLARTVSMLLLAAGSSVLWTPLQAQSKEVATAIEVEGQVSVLRGGQVALFQNGTVGVGQVIVTGPDGHAVFQIGDGSTFEVFPNSRVTFRDTFNFQDMLQLVLGKIRAQIEHRNGPNHKRVSTPTAVISVRGTVFDVSVEDEDGTTFVSVEEGQVEVQHRLQPGPSKFLNPNESVHVYPNQPLASVGGPSPGIKYIFDRIKGAVVDVALSRPGGIGSPGGVGLPGSGGASGGATGQGDAGKNKKNPPTGTPPGAPPAVPGGGN